ncbi:MAG TPA: hypothetical protein VGP93_17935, partial [Polyangiaceae bacterium]|nr:hypothetical protein [Polyangiaceae bacterium]
MSVAICNGSLWSPINEETNVSAFEMEHGMDPERSVYNERQIARVFQSKELVRGEHAGYSDLFQPIITRGDVVGILVTGPFARSRPTSAEIAERWRWLTGRVGHRHDPEFASYLQATLSTLVLEGERASTFERLLACYAELLAGEGRPDELATEMDALRADLEQARAVDQMWDAVRTMVAERSAHVWQSSARAFGLQDLGLGRMPDHVLVALAVGRTPTSDWVEEAIGGDAFQRASVELARSVSNVLAGRVGDHGVVFLSAAPGSAQRKKQKLSDIAARASAIARERFGLVLHCGMSIATGSMPLNESFQAALGAAQSALMQGTRIVVAEPLGSRPAYSLRHLYEELARIAVERPELLGARFDRYLGAVAIHCRHRLEPAQAHLEVGFERIADALLKSGALDQKSFEAMRARLDRAAAEATTINELFDAHRGAVADLAQAGQWPVPARQGRNLRGALDYIRVHYAEPLTLKKVAKVAGFNPSYFSELFTKQERMP